MLHLTHIDVYIGVPRTGYSVNSVLNNTKYKHSSCLILALDKLQYSPQMLLISLMKKHCSWVGPNTPMQLYNWQLSFWMIRPYTHTKPWSSTQGLGSSSQIVSLSACPCAGKSFPDYGVFYYCIIAVAICIRCSIDTPDGVLAGDITLARSNNIQTRPLW